MLKYLLLITAITGLMIMNNTGGLKKKSDISDICVDIENLKAHVKFLTEIRPFRNFNNPDSLDRAAGYILDNFKEHGRDAAYQIFNVRGGEFKNVMCYLGPEKAKRIIIGAHYDVCENQPGADDNASAVAGLIEILRILSPLSDSLKYRIDFVSYSLEEPPNFGTRNMGSYHHAAMLGENKIKVKGMVCLEMIGFFTEREGSQELPFALMKFLYPSKGNFISIVANIESLGFSRNMQRFMRRADIDVQSLCAPSIIMGVNFSDHKNYWEAGYNAVMITDTAFYRNPNYHQSTDTIDTLDFQKMSEVVRGTAWALLNI